MCDIPLERYFQKLSNGILRAPKYLKCQLVSQEKQICSCLAIAEHGGQKIRNEKTTAVFFSHDFLLVYHHSHKITRVSLVVAKIVGFMSTINSLKFQEEEEEVICSVTIQEINLAV